MHAWHEENGAEFENVGQWKRPWYYPQAGESLDDAVSRECLAVRSNVGIFDASTLGKIEIVGKDSAKFLEMIYTNNWNKLEVGKARYGFILGEDGMVMDDGVTIRLDEDHFFMHTTTGGAAGVMSWMERWLQTEWPDMEVYLTSVTDHWATAAVAGPNSRKIVSAICEGIDFDAGAFPFMASRTGKIGDVDCRVNRISFSGELAYEVNIPANHGRFMWEKLIQAGAEFDMTPYGTETMHVLRAEKGYVIVGQDTDALTLAPSTGMESLIKLDKDDFAGKPELGWLLEKGGYPRVVALQPTDPKLVPEEACQIVRDGTNEIAGRITSSRYSPTLDRSICLGQVDPSLAEPGTIVTIQLVDGRRETARVMEHHAHFDPEGERLRG